MSNQALSDEWQQAVASAISHEARMTASYMQQVAAEYERPCVVYRPKISRDGNLWCVLYGDNLQDGVAGFGNSPAMAMADFDKNWRAHS